MADIITETLGKAGGVVTDMLKPGESTAPSVDANKALMDQLGLIRLLQGFEKGAESAYALQEMEALANIIQNLPVDLTKKVPDILLEIRKVQAGLHEKLTIYSADLHKKRNEIGMSIAEKAQLDFVAKTLDAQKLRFETQLNADMTPQNGVLSGLSIGGLVGSLVYMFGVFKQDSDLMARGKEMMQASTTVFHATVPTQDGIIKGVKDVPVTNPAALPQVAFTPDMAQKMSSDMSTFLANQVAPQIQGISQNIINRARQEGYDLSMYYRGQKPLKALPGPSGRDTAGSAIGAVAALPVQEQLIMQRNVVEAIKLSARDYAPGMNISPATVELVLGAIAQVESYVGKQNFVEQGSTPYPSSAGSAFHFLDDTMRRTLVKYKSDKDIGTRMRALGIKDPEKADLRQIIQAKENEHLSTRLVTLELAEFVRSNPSLTTLSATDLATYYYMRHNLGESQYNTLMKSGPGALSDQVKKNNPSFFEGANSRDDVVSKYRTMISTRMQTYSDVVKRVAQANVPTAVASNPPIPAVPTPPPLRAMPNPADILKDPKKRVSDASDVLKPDRAVAAADVPPVPGVGDTQVAVLNNPKASATATAVYDTLMKRLGVKPQDGVKQPYDAVAHMAQAPKETSGDMRGRDRNGRDMSNDGNTAPIERPLPAPAPVIV